MLAWFLAVLSFAAPTLDSVEVTPEGFRTSYDVTVYVRKDGNLYVEDELVLDQDVAARVAQYCKDRGPDPRVVVAADPLAPYSRVIAVLDLVQQAGVGRVALEIGEATTPADPLSPVGKKATDLDDQRYDGELAKPRRWKYPQNPYASTDFTAYTREWGEGKLGIASSSYGVLPRLQVATSPALDVLGAYNLSGKGNWLRLGRFDSALSAGYALVPVTNIINALDPKGKYKIAGYQLNNQQIFVREMSFVSFALQNSMQLVGGWSIHAGVGYSRATAVGNLNINNLPTVVLPGLKPVGGNAVTIVPKIVAEAIDLRFATDYRFNRRDSLIFQYAATIYGAARGSVQGDISGVDIKGADLQNFQIALAYHQPISAAQSYRTSLAWQFSWEKVDLRFGVGLSAIPNAWLLGAFDLAYRFGGSTRRVEAAVRKQYKRDQIHHDLDDQDDAIEDDGSEE
jgi:biopolymer transport protein ExbD